MTDPKAPLPDVIRYGLEWTGPKDFVCKPMPDGYWTPWHIASTHIAALEAREQRLLSVIGRIYGAASRYYDATQSYYSDTDCDADGWLADTASDLKLLLLKHKAALAQTDGGV